MPQVNTCTTMAKDCKNTTTLYPIRKWAIHSSVPKITQTLPSNFHHPIVTLLLKTLPLLIGYFFFLKKVKDSHLFPSKQCIIPTVVLKSTILSYILYL